MTGRLNLGIALAVVLILTAGSPVLAGNNKNKVDPQIRIDQALVAMGSNNNTIAGPGHYDAGSDGFRIIYDVVSGDPPDVCITLRNRGTHGRVKIVVPLEPEEPNLRPGLTITRCYAAPTEIRLRCSGDSGKINRRCDAVWRIDRL